MPTVNTLSPLHRTSAFNSLNALCVITTLALLLFAPFAAGQASPVYGDCSVTTAGTPAYGPNPITGEYGGNPNGFLPYPSDYQLYQNISSAAVDPNSAVLISNLNTVSHNTLHILIGSAPADGDIPYYITDSSVSSNLINGQKVLPIVSGPGQSDLMIMPLPNNDSVPIEGDAADCSLWPGTTYYGDNHSLILDRNGCWLYEFDQTTRCFGSDLNVYYSPAGASLFDAQDFNARPWGFTSADASGMSIYVNTLKYDEAASGQIKHPIRFTVPTSAGSSAFILPASHGASSSSLANKLPEGALLRLNPSRTPTISTAGMSTEDATVIIPAIIAGLQNYGMIMADNGSNMYLIGDNDPRWNDSDLAKLSAIVASDFDVMEMVPEYPTYMTESTAWTTYYPDTSPALSINSYTATPSGSSAQTGTITVAANTPVTFNFCVTGTNWNETFTATTAEPFVYIDNIGPARLNSEGCGSLTTTPAITQEYTLYALNTQVDAINEGLPPNETINIVVTGAATTPAQVVFIPPPMIINGTNLGYTYAADSLTASVVTSTWAPLGTNDNVFNSSNATYFYTTATGTTTSTSTIPNTTSPLPTESGGVAGSATTMISTSSIPTSITVTKSAGASGHYGYEVVCAIATVPAIGSSYGNANPSPSSCATYVFTGSSSSYANAPIILPPSGTYNTPQAVTMGTAPNSTSAIYYTTDGSTPSTAGTSGGSASGTPPDLPTLIFSQGQSGRLLWRGHYFWNHTFMHPDTGLRHQRHDYRSHHCKHQPGQLGDNEHLYDHCGNAHV